MKKKLYISTINKIYLIIFNKGRKDWKKINEKLKEEIKDWIKSKKHKSWKIKVRIRKIRIRKKGWARKKVGNLNKSLFLSGGFFRYFRRVLRW